MKSSHSLTFPLTKDKYDSGWSIYRINFQRQLLDSGYYMGSGVTTLEPRRSSAALEMNVKFEIDLTSNVDALIYFCYNESVSLGKTEISPRHIKLSYPL